jgi:hypothetical protein
VEANCDDCEANPGDLMFATEVEIRRIPLRAATVMAVPIEDMLDRDFDVKS